MRNTSRAVLTEYNDESLDEYLQRLMMDAMSNKESDPTKVIIAWCYGHFTRYYKIINCLYAINNKNI